MEKSRPVVMILEIVDRLTKSWGLLLAIPCLAGAFSVLAFRYAPKTFEATTSIFVAPSQLPQDFVRNRANDDMTTRLASLRESVLSRPYLLKLAQDIYRVAEGTPEADRYAAVIRGGLQVEITNFDPQRGSGLFTLTYRDSDPDRVADVCNRMAALYIEENARQRASQAGTTVRVMASLADELGAQLKEREEQIAAFKQANLYQLGGQLEANLRLLDGRLRDADNNDRLLADAENRKKLLVGQRALSQTTVPGAAGTTIPAQDPLLQQLSTARTELGGMESRYLPSHPSVQAKRQEVADLERRVKERAESGGPVSNDPKGPTTTIEIEIENADREIVRLRANGDRYRNEIEMYRRRIESAPKVEQEFAELTKGYEAMKQKYAEYQKTLENSRAMEKVEQVRQGEQFEILEKAVAPRMPIRPSPMMILIGSVGLAFALTAGPMLGRALFFPRVYSRAGLRQFDNVPVLVSIPGLASEQQVRRAKHQRWFNISVTAASLAVLVVVLWLVSPERGA